MSDPWGTPWSDHPNAPRIPSWDYRLEKGGFAGFFSGAIAYAIVTALFFQCMCALLSPANPISRSTRWVLVAHTMALFSFSTIPTAIELNYLPIVYIDGRDFPGNDELSPGPLGYRGTLNSQAATTVFDAMFPLNQWLADGLLLHRCYVIYSMNHWIMAVPCMMYLASVVVSISDVYQNVGMRLYTPHATNTTTSYLSICLPLSVLLTLMIIIRLVKHIRNVRKLTGASDGSSGLNTAAAAVVTMLIESYALYAVALLLFIAPWAVESVYLYFFARVLGAVRVIAPYLIILRVAKRRAMTSESISGSAGSVRFKSEGSTDVEGAFLRGGPTNTMGANGEAPVEPGAGGDNVIEEVPLR